MFIIIGCCIALSFNTSLSGAINNNYNKNTNEVIDNHPPEPPYFTYFWMNGYQYETYNFSFTTTDPDGDDIYYFIDWADGSNSGWLGPYKSDFVYETTHAWNESGYYYYRIKAKDSYGAESNWSSSSYTQIFITAHVTIYMHRGFGVGVTVTVKNIGIKDYENIPWCIEFYRSPREKPMGKEIYGILKSLKVGEEVTIRSGFIFKFAFRSIITFDFSAPINLGVGYDYCKIFGPFVDIPIDEMKLTRSK